jgi:hypothetical protein
MNFRLIYTREAISVILTFEVGVCLCFHLAYPNSTSFSSFLSLESLYVLILSSMLKLL